MTKYQVYRVCAALTALVTLVIVSGAGNKFAF
jgi:hypothetical protein